MQHFINAIIEADPMRLSKVAVLRLGAPYTAQCPPFADFPERLRMILDGHYALLDGGIQSWIVIIVLYLASESLFS